MNPFFREARVVDHERFDARQPPIKFEREPTDKLRVRPATLRDAPEQALPNRLDLTLVVHQPRRHRLDELAELSVQPRQLASIHINRRSKTEFHVNRNRPSSTSRNAAQSNDRR